MTPNARRAGAMVAVAATTVAIMPMIVAVVTSMGREMYPIGDNALIDLMLRQVFTTSTPLLGTYSRFGWYHPGPSTFWILAPFSFAAGGRPWGAVVGIAVVQAVAVVVCARVAWRRSGLLVTLAVLMVQALAYLGIRADYPWLRPWNPFVAFPCLVLLLLAVWYAGLGDLSLLPLVAVVGTVVVQAHVGYAPLVALGAGWVTWFTVRTRAWTVDRARWRKTLMWTAAALSALWLPTLIEQVRKGRGGNIVRIVRSTFGELLPGGTQNLETGYRVAGLDAAARLFGAQLQWLPPWLGGSPKFDAHGFAVGASPAWLLGAAVLLLVALGWSRRRGAREAVHLVTLVGLAAIVGLLSLARLRGEFAEYAFYWRTPLAVLAVVVPLAVMVASLPAIRRPRARAGLAAALAVGVAGPSVWMTVRVADGDQAQERFGGVVETLVTQIRARPAPQGTVALRQTGDLGLYWGVPVGVFAELERRGMNITVSARYAKSYLEGHYGAPPEVGDQVWFVAQGANVSRLAGRPGARVVATSSPLDPTNEQRLRVIQQRVDAQLRTAGREDLAHLLDADYPSDLAAVKGLDQHLVRELVRLNAKVGGWKLRYAVIAFSHRDAPRDVKSW